MHFSQNKLGDSCTIRILSSTEFSRLNFSRIVQYSSIIHRILDMVVSPTFHNRYVKLLPAEQTPPEIQNDPKLYQFFKDCRGAIDGTHIVALSQMMLWLTIRIIKASYHRISSQQAHSICASVMFFPDGKEVPPMGMYLMMHADTVSPFHLGHTFWKMLDFRHVQVLLYLSPIHDIISRGGPEHQKGL